MTTPFDPAIFDPFIFDSFYDGITYGSGIRTGVGWKFYGLKTSNPGEYNPYTRHIPDAITITSGVELGFGGGDFGEGDFGVGENLMDPTFTQETPSTPVYT